jgi:hypothetical protein
VRELQDLGSRGRERPAILSLRRRRIRRHCASRLRKQVRLNGTHFKDPPADRRNRLGKRGSYRADVDTGPAHGA